MKKISKRQSKIGKKIHKEFDPAKWRDWKWQIKHSVSTIERFEWLTGIKFPKKERQELAKTIKKFPLSITPYYLSLIDFKNYKTDPIFKQAFADVREADVLSHEFADPLSEDKDSPAPGLTHRYPDRVLFHVSNVCSMYCRHCTRKRKVGDKEYIPDKKELLKGIKYIKDTPQIRDVLLSGGDPLMLSDDYLDWLLTELKKIKHVEIIRIGSRIPVVLPYRITDNLINMLKKHQPIWINTHFNHPRELTQSSREALRKLADGGFPLGNQSVLLAEINDCPRIIKSLIQKLVYNRVRPYYLYQCDLSEGLAHFRTPSAKGIEIMESLVGHTSGFARPIYVIDAPGGAGKIPLAPNYILSWSTNKIVIRNYEGVISTYKEPEKYQTHFCDGKCESCRLDLYLEDASEIEAIGIQRLLAEYDEEITLVPKGNVRFKRRKNG